MDKIITKSYLIELLEKYIKGDISLKELELWRDKLGMVGYEFEVEDWEGDNSFINEVLSRLDMLDIDGLTIDESKKIIELLKTKDSVENLTKKLYSINN